MQRAHRAAGDGELAQVEEFDLGERSAVRLREDVERGWTLHLEAIDLPPAGRVGRSALVTLDGYVVVPGLGVELHPVVRGRATDEAHAVLVEEEEDRVADDVAVVVAGDELLGLADLEARERVDAEVGEQADDVRAFEVEVGHVVRLVEERGGLAPRDLLVHPVRELARDGRVDIRPDLRVARHLDRAADRLQLLLQTPVRHLLCLLSRPGRPGHRDRL